MRVKSVLALCRVSNLPTVWMNVICASVLVAHTGSQPLNIGLVVSLALVASAFYCAGMALNDLCDYSWDQQHQPYRPLVAGKLSLQQARGITGFLFALAFGLLWWVAPFASGLIAGAALFAVILAYNLLHKKHPASVLLMASARALVYVMVAQSLAGELAGLICLAAALQFGYTLSLSLVARHENQRGKPYAGPVIPRMIAAMALVDGALLALLVSPWWLLVGAALAWLTRLGQRYVRGD